MSTISLFSLRLRYKSVVGPLPHVNVPAAELLFHRAQGEFIGREPLFGPVMRKRASVVPLSPLPGLSGVQPG